MKGNCGCLEAVPSCELKRKEERWREGPDGELASGAVGAAGPPLGPLAPGLVPAPLDPEAHRYTVFLLPTCSLASHIRAAFILRAANSRDLSRGICWLLLNIADFTGDAFRDQAMFS